MASEVITRNDLKDILNEVLPPTPSEYKKLLWTNSTSPFAAQTVSIDPSAYEYIEVWFGSLTTDDAMLPNPLLIPLGERREIVVLHALGNSGTNENTGVRDVTVSATGVTFGDYNYKNRRTGGGLTTANQFAVPIKIYGVKCERVNPPQVEETSSILEKTVTGTTNAYGAINLNLPWATNEIVSVTSSLNTQYCIPFSIGASTYAKVLNDAATFSIVANTSVTLTVRYRTYSL